MVIWRDVPVPITIKMSHCQRRGAKYKHFRSIINDYGDLPWAILSAEGQCSKVENTRGMAYACRNRMKYRNKKAYKRDNRIPC